MLVVIQKFGWRTMFQLAGVSSSLVGMVALLFIKDKKQPV